MPKDKESESAVIAKRTGRMSKISDVFGLDDVQDVKTYVIYNVVIPGLKNLFFDFARTSLETLLFKNHRDPSNIVPFPSSNRRQQTGYHKMAKPIPESSIREAREPRSTSNLVETLIFPSRGAAERAIWEMQERIAECGMVRVNEYYEIAGVSTDNYQLKNFVWRDLSGAKTVFNRGLDNDGEYLEGYTIYFPNEPEYIK